MNNNPLHLQHAMVQAENADPSSLPELHLNNAKANIELTMYDVALCHITSAIDLYEDVQSDIPPAFHEIGINIHDTALVLYNQGDFNKATYAFMISLKVKDYFTTRPPYSARIEIPTIKVYIAKCLLGIEQYEAAREYCIMAIEDYLKLGFDISDRIVVDVTELIDEIWHQLHVVPSIENGDFAPAA